jgi:hypothetical protein
VPESDSPNPSAYHGFGFVDNPFPPIDASATSPYWMRVLTHAASNRLLGACLRGKKRGRPVMLVQTDKIPDTYPRAALNEFLSTSASDPGMSMLAMNSTLDCMRLGTIRGPLTEFAERVTAMNLPLTVGLYFADVLQSPQLDLPEAAALAEGQLSAVADAFASDPAGTMERYLGRRGSDSTPTRDEEFDALHRTYLRGVHLEKSPEEETDHSQPTDDVEDPFAPEAPDVEENAVVDPDEAMREYLLAVLRTELSPVVARSLAKYATYGENMVAQELRVTKAPRKTLDAVLRLMSHRWSTIVFIWEGFEVWPNLEQQTRLDVMAALNELRWIIGKYGVMGLSLLPGMAPELDEVFAAAEMADLSIPGFSALYGCDTVAWDGELAQSWIDSAALTPPSGLLVESEALAPLVSAADGDLLRFALASEVAFRNAAERCTTELDGTAVAAGIASVKVEEGA